MWLLSFVLYFDSDISFFQNLCSNIKLLIPFFNPLRYLSNHPFVHPYWLSHKPKTHAACVMQCLAMGNAALKVDCTLHPKPQRAECPGTAAKDGQKLKDAVDGAKQSISASCMQGCSAGIPFMFNWTDPIMPGIPVASPHTWMLGLTSHLGTDDGGGSLGSLGSGDYGASAASGSPISPFNPPSEIAQGPADRGSCIAQCLSMGHDAVARYDTWVDEHSPPPSPPLHDVHPTIKVTEMQKTQMFYTCARGCDAGTPFMFNFSNPSMAGKIVV